MDVLVLVLNGPNLGRLGRREPETYGSTTYDELVELCRATGRELGLQVEVRQTDAEHEMIRWIHEAADAQTPVVLNPAAWAHTSIALRDACAELRGPLIEVHLTNTHAREPFRAQSYVAAVATGVVAGLGVRGYLLALRWLAETEQDGR